MVITSENLLRATGGASLVLVSFGLNRILNNSTVSKDLDTCGRANVSFGLAGSIITGALVSYTGVRSMF
jgi:hypothetical protein